MFNIVQPSNFREIVVDQTFHYFSGHFRSLNWAGTVKSHFFLYIPWSLARKITDLQMQNGTSNNKNPSIHWAAVEARYHKPSTSTMADANAAATRWRRFSSPCARSWTGTHPDKVRPWAIDTPPLRGTKDVGFHGYHVLTIQKNQIFHMVLTLGHCWHRFFSLGI